MPLIASAEQREPAKKSVTQPLVDRVAVPRRIIYLQGILLGLVALVFFVFGLIVGSTASRRDGELAEGPFVVAGRVTFRDADEQPRADEGSVILLLPQDVRPEERVPPDGLRPGDSMPAADQRGLVLLHEAGGAYARCDVSGRFRVRAPRRGPYFLLVISRHQQRDADAPPERRALAQLGRFILPPADLLGQQSFEWHELVLTADETVDVAF